MASRYARRKHRTSTKIRAAANNAVKPATACHVRAFSYLCHVQTCPEHLPRCHPLVHPASDVIPGLNPPLVSSLVYPVSDVIPGFNPGIFWLSPPKPEMTGKWQEKEKECLTMTIKKAQMPQNSFSESGISGKSAPKYKKTLRFVSFWVRDSAKFVQPSAARIHFVSKKS